MGKGLAKPQLLEAMGSGRGAPNAGQFFNKNNAFLLMHTLAKIIILKQKHQSILLIITFEMSCSLNVLNRINKVYKICNISINVTKCDVTLATKGRVLTPPLS